MGFIPMHHLYNGLIFSLNMTSAMQMLIANIADDFIIRYAPPNQTTLQVIRFIMIKAHNSAYVLTRLAKWQCIAGSRLTTIIKLYVFGSFKARILVKISF